MLPTSRASTVSSTAASANGRSISLARWNSHYLIPPASATGIDSTPVASFVAPDWVLVTAQGPTPAPPPGAVIGRYAFAVYDEGGLMNLNLGGFPTYASLSSAYSAYSYSKIACEVSFGRERNYAVSRRLSGPKIYAGSYKRNFSHGSSVLPYV